MLICLSFLRLRCRSLHIIDMITVWAWALSSCECFVIKLILRAVSDVIIDWLLITFIVWSEVDFIAVWNDATAILIYDSSFVFNAYLDMIAHAD